MRVIEKGLIVVNRVKNFFTAGAYSKKGDLRNRSRNRPNAVVWGAGFGVKKGVSNLGGGATTMAASTENKTALAGMCRLKSETL